MEWRHLQVSGTLSNQILAYEAKIDVFNYERYIRDIPLNPILRLYGINTRSISIYQEIIQLVHDMPETEMPEWLREAFVVVAQASPMFEALSRQNQAVDVHIVAEDPWVPGVYGRTFRAVGIDGVAVYRDRRFEIDIVDVGRRPFTFNVVHEDDRRLLADGFIFLPDFQRIYYHLSGFNKSYVRQWWSAITEWIRMPTVTRTQQLNNIPIPEIRPSPAFPSLAMPFEMIARFRLFDSGVELTLESPKAQSVNITVRDLNFNELARTAVSIESGGELKRVRIVSRFGRLPDMNIEIKPQYETKLVNARVLSWFDVWTGR